MEGISWGCFRVSNGHKYAQFVCTLHLVCTLSTVCLIFQLFYWKSNRVPIRVFDDYLIVKTEMWSKGSVRILKKKSKTHPVFLVRLSRA